MLQFCNNSLIKIAAIKPANDINNQVADFNGSEDETTTNEIPLTAGTTDNVIKHGTTRLT